MIIVGTGHRKIGLVPGHTKGLENFCAHILTVLEPTLVIDGMALGFDQALADACCRLDIPWVAAVPFVGQEKIWPQHDQDHYHWLLKKASMVHVVCPVEGGGAAQKMDKRNRWMVDQISTVLYGDFVLAMWDGSSSGGTMNCVSYAERAGKRVVNVWKQWKEFKGGAG